MSDDLHQRAQAIPDPPPDAATLLADLVAFLRRYVAMSLHQAIAVALWVVHTHAAEAAEFTPYLAVTSPEKRSGKTLLLDLLGRLVHAPLSVANTSAAALYRSIEKIAPTLLFDEVDAIFTRNGGDREQELRGILNAGFRRGPMGTVLRTVGPQHTPMRFPVYCPKALAGIGDLPDTITDRSIVIRMKRKRPADHVERMRSRDVAEPAAAMRFRVSDWVAAEIDALSTARPELPDALDDRAADIWEPLLAIADLAGGAWPATARAAAIALSSGRDDDASYGVRLLADVRQVFLDAGTDRMASAAMCAGLNAMEEAPWGGWGEGKGIDPRTLARRLRPYEVRPDSVRILDGTVKGYLRAWFADAWASYCPVKDPEDRPQPPAGDARSGTSGTTRMGTGISADSRTEQEGSCSVQENGDIPHGYGVVPDVPDEACDPGGNEMLAEGDGWSVEVERGPAGGS
jgi:Protein of unknown function (DUF3631)